MDGNYEGELIKICKKIAKIVEGFNAREVLFADNPADKETLWKLRRSVGEAIKSSSIYKEEDTVVSRASLAQF